MVKIIYTKNKIGNGKSGDRKRNAFIGMNEQAYKSIFRKKYPYSKDTILIYDKMSPEKKERTLKHELVELELMKDDKANFGYKKSHEIANALEDSDIIKVRGSKRARGYTRQL